MTSSAPPELITVLGASGFVGSAVVAALADRSVRLRLVSRRPAPVPAGCRADVEVRTADLGVAEHVAAAVADADAVLDLVVYPGGLRAAEQDPAADGVNAGLVNVLLDALRGGGRRPAPAVLFAGSTTQVGTAPMPIDGTEPDRPEAAFDRQKQRAENALMAATAEGVARGVSLRLPTVFGRGPAGVTDPGVLTFMTRRALAGEPLTMWDDGTVLRDLVHIRDAAAAYVAALDRVDALAGRHWVVGTGRGEPLGDVFRAIAEIVAEHNGRPPVPVVSVEPPAHAAVADQQDMVVDASAFRAATGWAPQVSLRDGLRHTVEELAGEVPASSPAGS